MRIPLGRWQCGSLNRSVPSAERPEYPLGTDTAWRASNLIWDTLARPASI